MPANSANSSGVNAFIATAAQQPESYYRVITMTIAKAIEKQNIFPEPTVCSDCGAVYRHGRWQWAESLIGTHKIICPACRCIRDKIPASSLILKGGFFQFHREEILQLIRNVVAWENTQHPLKRILAVEQYDDGVLISFTDPRLAHGAGKAVYHAYQGELNFSYAEENTLLRVYWKH